jgi:pyruvate formate lyase activating enzyme
MQALLFNIQHFSIHDGPGIRTTVFFKGCNLSCLWCHNPEAVRREVEIEFYPERCIACGACVEVCPEGAQLLEGSQRVYLRDACQLCLRCTEECFAEGLIVSGREYDPAGIAAEIERDRTYYVHSQGGVTFSGGEPMLQVDFLSAVLGECRQRGIHTAVDTAGNVAWSLFEQIIPLTDLFLYDIKAFDAEIHTKATGAGNRRILENLKHLSERGCEIWVRIPVIPEVNDAEEEMRAIADFLSPLAGIRWVELLPFHTLGAEKYPSLGREYPMKAVRPPSKEKMKALEAIFTDRGLSARCME